MTVVSFINPSQQEVIHKILAHCGLLERPGRAPPPAAAATSPQRELTYVGGPEYADPPARELDGPAS